ncbi:alpha/beta hydrolase [Novosphingobium aquae]|uniref:Alpha/beta hydrolase n=1 Tax=Novosphingobium aquae TaxID=3133435 RepID=A0ABU8SBJ3_9SPHN
MTISRHLVDPELLPGLELIPSVEFTLEDLPAIRERMAEFTRMGVTEDLAGVSTTEDFVPSPQGHKVRVLIHRPDNLPPAAPVVVYSHGGGFLLGSAESMRLSNQLMARDVQCLVVSVDYRLPPEVPHPGPVEDCYAALKWVHDNAPSLGIDPTRIAVAGESAGGGLAAATALLARDRDEISLAYQHLIYPMLDDRTGPDTANPYAGEFVWTAGNNQLGWSALLGEPAGGEGVCGYASPSRAQDLSGLPRTFITVGALDLFADENLEFARRLMRAGVSTELHLYPGAYHGFELAKDAPVTKSAHETALAALRRGLAPAFNPTSESKGSE